MSAKVLPFEPRPWSRPLDPDESRGVLIDDERVVAAQLAIRNRLWKGLFEELEQSRDDEKAGFVMAKVLDLRQVLQSGHPAKYAAIVRRSQNRAAIEGAGDASATVRRWPSVLEQVGDSNAEPASEPIDPDAALDT